MKPVEKDSPKEEEMYDSFIERLSKEEIEKIQLEKFNNLLNICRNAKIYSKSNLPKEISSLEEIKKLPFTTKEQLREGYPYDSLCVNLNEVVELHTSSGTTGNPVPLFLTGKDLKRSNEVLARTWFCNGIRKEDIFMMMGDYGLFTGGLLNHYALTSMGTFVIPIGSRSTEKQIHFLKDFKVTSLAGIASHYFRILEKMKEQKISREDLHLKVAIAAGEPYSNETRKFFEKKFGCVFMDQYGLAEINTGLAGECKYKCGLHIPHDYVYPEIVSPNTGEVLKEGEEGELVLTTLEREGNPVIRYRTGDITSLQFGKCKCGRTTPRIARIKGRVDDVLFVKGIKLYPSSFESILWEFKKDIKPQTWSLKIERIHGLDELTLSLEKENSSKTDLNLRNEISDKLRERVGIRFTINIVSSVEWENKMKRIIDLRDKPGAK